MVSIENEVEKKEMTYLEEIDTRKKNLEYTGSDDYGDKPDSGLTGSLYHGVIF